jgi:hypothetical protein
MAEASQQEVEEALKEALKEAGLKPQALDNVVVRVRHLAKIVARDAYAESIRAAGGSQDREHDAV